jgi:hypothetical protein
MLLPLPRLARLAWRFVKGPGDLEFHDRDIAGGEQLDGLGPALDDV